MREPSSLRRAVMAGTLALSLTGVTAAVEGAQAMPLAATLAPSSAGSAATAVRYMRHPSDRYRRFNRHRRAGLYRCGPGGASTHLERKACR